MVRRTITHSINVLAAFKAYGFEGIDDRTGYLLEQWEVQFPEGWIAMAVVEAVYQGRYKVISVQQILLAWQRRGEPRTNFDWALQQQVLRDTWEPVIPVPMPVTPPLRLGQQPVLNRLRELVGVA